MAFSRGPSLDHEVLPPPGFGVGGIDRADNRWVASRKEAVVKAVQCGQIALSTARRDYGLSFEEFLSWATAFDQGGRAGLRTLKGLASLRAGTRYRLPYTDEPAPPAVVERNAPASVTLPALKFMEDRRG